MNKTREQWARIDPKFCAENNSIAAMTFLLADAKEDIENLHRERAALAAECERLRAQLIRRAEAERGLRQLLRETTAVAITMLYASHKADALVEFGLSELEEVVHASAHLQGETVERVYRRAWDAAVSAAQEGKSHAE